MKTALLTLLISATSLTVIAQSRIVKSADIESEKRLYTDIEIDYGTINLNSVGNDHLFMVNVNYNRDKANPTIQFDRDGSESTFKFRTNGKNININLDDDDEENSDEESSSKSTVKNANTSFSGTIELGMKVEQELKFSLGAGSGNLDLSGLKLTNLEVSSGAGTMQISCNSQNPNVIREAKIQTGVGKIKMDGILNLNIKRMNIEGGVGSFELDFSGIATGKRTVKIETGIGSVVIKVPRHVGARIIDDSSFFSNLSVPRDYKKKSGNYQSPNYQDAESTIEFVVSSGMGSVKFQMIN